MGDDENDLPMPEGGSGVGDPKDLPALDAILSPPAAPNWGRVSTGGVPLTQINELGEGEVAADDDDDEPE
jgi:hypothetical protein